MFKTKVQCSYSHMFNVGVSNQYCHIGILPIGCVYSTTDIPVLER